MPVPEIDECAQGINVQKSPHTHRLAKASAARQVANVALSLESYIGCMPPRTARELYLAQLDPHLTYGCNVNLDIDEASLLCLEQVQLTYLRRVLLLSPRSLRVVLFVMMNLWPLCRFHESDKI